MFSFVTKLWSGGDTLQADDLNDVVQDREVINGVATPTAGRIDGGTSPSATTVFDTLAVGANDGAITAQIDGVLFKNVPVSLRNLASGTIIADGGVSFGSVSTNTLSWQTFTATANQVSLTLVGLNIWNSAGGVQNYTIELRQTNSTGTLLGTATVSIGAGVTDTTYSFNFGTIALTPGAVYCITCPAQTTIAVRYSTTNWYAGGASNYGNDLRFSVSGQTHTALSTSTLATAVQTAIRAVTGGSETVAYSTNKYVITSGNVGQATQVLKLIAPTAGTDITGNAVTKYLDCGTGATEVAGTGHSVNRASILVGGITPSSLATFQSLGNGANDGKIKASIDGVVYDDIAVSLTVNPAADYVSVTGGTDYTYTLDDPGVNNSYGAIFTAHPTLPKLTKVSMWLKNTGATTGNFDLNLYLGTPGYPTGSVLATSTVPMSSIPTGSYGFVDFVFNTVLTPGAVYAVYPNPANTSCTSQGPTGGGTTNAFRYFGGYQAFADRRFNMKVSFGATVSTLAEVATAIQTAIRAVTSKTETVLWTGSQFTVKSSLSTLVSSVLALMTPTTGTDMSGNGATKYFDLGSGATSFEMYSDYNKIPKLDEKGKLPSDFVLMKSGVRVVNAVAPTASTWTTLDLSSIIGASAKLVVLKVSATGGPNYPHMIINFRPYGDTDYGDRWDDITTAPAEMGWGANSAILYGRSAQSGANAIVMTDSSGRVQWGCFHSTAISIDLVAVI